MKKKKIGFKAIALVAAIDLNGQVVARHIVDKAIDHLSFMEFLDIVAKFTKKKRAIMLLDNLQIHRKMIV